MTANDPAGPVLAVFAHPDDESFSCSGLFTRLRDNGVPVTLVSATRGEAGEIRGDIDAPQGELGRVRKAELRAAMAHLGVTDVRFLGYRDSGMRGTPDNQHPQALMQAPVEEVSAHIVDLLKERRPAAVVTFGQDGIYGHPDHVAIHRATHAAVLQAGNDPDGWRVAALYFATAPREQILARAANVPNSPLASLSPEELAQVGTPVAEITTIFNLTPEELQRKLAALLAHRSQFGDAAPWSALPPAEIEAWLGHEHFVRASLPWDESLSLTDPIARLTG